MEGLNDTSQTSPRWGGGSAGTAVKQTAYVCHFASLHASASASRSTSAAIDGIAGGEVLACHVWVCELIEKATDPPPSDNAV